MIKLKSVSFDLFSVKAGGINFHLPAGDTAVILGPHNSGKSVIIKICLGLIPVTSGEVIIEGENILAVKKQGQAKILRKIGYVPKGPSLLDNLTVAGNIGLPLMYHSGTAYGEMVEKIRPTLIRFGLEKISEKFPSDLSRNDTRLVQMARAIIQKPKLLFIHEPTAGDLDPDGFVKVAGYIRDLQKEKTTILITTSSPALAAACANSLYIFLDSKLVKFADALESQSPIIIQYLKSLRDYSNEQDAGLTKFFSRERTAE